MHCRIRFGSSLIALAVMLLGGENACAQDLQDRAVAAPPPPAQDAAPRDDEITFSANELSYDSEGDIVVASGDVRLYRRSDKLRADRVEWNRKTGRIIATGNVVSINAKGDTAYGDRVELTDALRDGVIENMLVVLDRGGRLAAREGTRDTGGVVTLNDAAYTPCAVTDGNNCPRTPSWQITAVRVVYNPDRERIYYRGAKLRMFGWLSLPLPGLSNHVGNGSDSGFLSPDIRYGRVNGFEYAQPFYLAIGANRGLKITPRIYSRVLPMVQAEYSALLSKGAYRIAGYATSSDRSDAVLFGEPPAPSTGNIFRGYIESVARFQLTPEWSVSGAVRLTTDRTFLRRYDISRDDLLRNTLRVDRIDSDSYFAVQGWAVQTLRVNDRQGLQPIAFPEVDYRRRFRGLAGGTLEVQLNTLAVTRPAGEDVQRGFISARWDLRRITTLGQELILTAYGRGDVHHTDNSLVTQVVAYRGDSGVNARAIGALAAELRWPLIGRFLSGTQRITPRVQLVATPGARNAAFPNEDSRAVDLEDTNLFSLNRFPGYDRWDDASRITYGVDWNITIPNFTLNANVGQSYSFGARATMAPTGTGFSERLSDIVGRTELRYRDFVSLVHRYRLDKGNFAIRRNEIDATIGTRATYVLIGYLNLNRDIPPTLEDLRDREEIRGGARVQIARYWSLFGSTVIDLTTRRADPLSLTDGFAPIRHRIGFLYEDDCLRAGITYRRDYQNTGDARSGDAFLLTLAFKNLGR